MKERRVILLRKLLTPGRILLTMDSWYTSISLMASFLCRHGSRHVAGFQASCVGRMADSLVLVRIKGEDKPVDL